MSPPALPPPGREVAGEALPPFLAYSKETTGSEDTLFANGLEHLLDRPNRFDWSDLCELYRRLDARLAGDRALERLIADRALTMPVFGSLMKMAGLVASPKLLYTLGNRFGLSRIFSHLLLEEHVEPDGRIVLNLRIPQSHEDSPQFFRATAGILTSLPKLVGLPDALVHMELGPRHARYEITPPPSATVLSRVKRAVTAFTLGRHALREMTDQQARLNAQYQELQRAYATTKEALAVRRRFLSVISHELRTPLNGIVGASSVLKTEGDPEVRAELTEALDISIADMSRLVESILEFTRLDQGLARPSHAPFGPRAGLQPILHAVRLDAQEKGLDFRMEFAPDLPKRVSVDGHRVQQIAAQILDNALKFTDEGRIVVRLGMDAAEQLVLEVQDTGPGIAAEDQARIFEMFTQLDDSERRSRGGIGLGLTLSQRLVEVLGGRLKLESEPGVGTQVRVEIPVVVLSAAPPERVRGDPEVGRVLVVDDVRINRRVLRRALERWGWDVDEAVNGEEAVVRAKAQPYTMILMDCEMPVLDGFEATLRIRDEAPTHAPIVAVTAYVTDDDRARCFEVGMDDFLGKPAKLPDLEQALQRWVGVTRRPDSSAR